MGIFISGKSGVVRPPPTSAMIGVRTIADNRLPETRIADWR